jgi:deoxyxylulose-5-phosphate synthase
MNIDVSVASVPFATEIDLDYLRSAAAKGPIITLEEHSKRGGFGSIILESLNQLDVTYKLKIIASTQQNLSEIGSQDYLQIKNGLDEKSIVDAFNSIR